MKIALTVKEKCKLLFSKTTKLAYVCLVTGNDTFGKYIFSDNVAIYVTSFFLQIY